MLEHIEDDERVRREMKRALLPGGGLIPTVPHHPLLWSAADSYALHKRRYTRATLVGRVERAGIRVRRVTSFVTLLMPLLLLSLLRRRSPSQFDPLAEFRIPSIANRALGAVMTVERALIRAGASLPAGESLLLIGEPAA